MRRLFRYLKGYEKETVIAPLFKMLEACFELLVPLVVARIVMKASRTPTCPLSGGSAACWCFWPWWAWPAA